VYDFIYKAERKLEELCFQPTLQVFVLKAAARPATGPSTPDQPQRHRRHDADLKHDEQGNCPKSARQRQEIPKGRRYTLRVYELNQLTKTAQEIAAYSVC
jgi:hypothetical protein